MTRVDHRRLLLAVLVAVVADALTKLAAVRWLTGTVDLGVLDLRVTRNPGVAFSLGADQPAVVVLAFTGVAVLALAVAAWRGHLGGSLPAGLVVGGGLANLADRAIGGSVVDLFDLGWWPVFNLADVFITTGVGLLLLAAFAHDGGRDAPELSGPEIEDPVRGHS